MNDANEIVVVDLTMVGRAAVDCAIGTRLNRFTTDAVYKSLDLGINLPPGWPLYERAEVTFSQLIVLAKKLKMRIRICELVMEPL